MIQGPDSQKFLQDNDRQGQNRQGSSSFMSFHVFLSLSMDKHAAAVSAKCFFQLRQVRRKIRRSLDDNAVATLVHAFVASRVEYCGSLSVGTPKKTTDKLQRVLNAAVRLVWCRTLASMTEA